MQRSRHSPRLVGDRHLRHEPIGASALSERDLDAVAVHIKIAADHGKQLVFQSGHLHRRHVDAVVHQHEFQPLLGHFPAVGLAPTQERAINPIPSS